MHLATDQTLAGQGERDRLQSELDRLRDHLRTEEGVSAQHKSELAQAQGAKEIAVTELAKTQAAMVAAEAHHACSLRQLREEIERREHAAAKQAQDAARTRNTLIESLERKMAEKESESEQTKRMLAEMSHKVREAEESSAAVDALARLREEKDNLAEELRTQEEAKLQAEMKVQRLQADASIAKQGAQHQCTALYEGARVLETENSKLLEEKNRLQGLLDAAETARSEQEHRARDQLAAAAAEAEVVGTEHKEALAQARSERDAFEKQAVDAKAVLASAISSHERAIQQTADQVEKAHTDLVKQLTEKAAELSAATKVLAMKDEAISAAEQAHGAELARMKHELESLATASSAEDELRKQYDAARDARKELEEKLVTVTAAHTQEMRGLQEAHEAELNSMRRTTAHQATEAEAHLQKLEAARLEHNTGLATLRQQYDALERESKLRNDQAVRDMQKTHVAEMSALQQAYAHARSEWVRKSSQEQAQCASLRGQLAAAEQTIQNLQATKSEELLKLQQHMTQTVHEMVVQEQAHKAQIAQLQSELAQAAAMGPELESEPEPEPEPEMQPVFTQHVTHVVYAGGKKAEKCKVCGNLLFGTDIGGAVQNLLNDAEAEIQRLCKELQEYKDDKERNEILMQMEEDGEVPIGRSGRKLTTARTSATSSTKGATGASAWTPPPPTDNDPALYRPRLNPGKMQAPSESVTPPSTRGVPNSATTSVGNIPAAVASKPPPQHASASRADLHKLEELGFDTDLAHRALEETGGDIMRAIDRLSNWGNEAV